MNAYDEALYKVLDEMLAANGCDLENGMLRPTMSDKYRNKIRDKGPDPMLSETSVRELADDSDSHSQYPRAHTHKNTAMKMSMDKEYETVRECLAENQLRARRALNGFYLRCGPNISLTGAETKEESFKVLTPNPSKQLACFSALMPKSDVFEKDIYEDKEEITHPAPCGKVSIISEPGARSWELEGRNFRARSQEPGSSELHGGY